MKARRVPAEMPNVVIELSHAEAQALYDLLDRVETYENVVTLADPTADGESFADSNLNDIVAVVFDALTGLGLK